MLTPEELSLLLSGSESDRIEGTESTRDTDKFAQEVCAFANDFPNNGKPGYLVIGVNNQGRPVELSITDQLLQNLGALRSDGNIQPLPAMVVQKLTLSGQDVAVVEVSPSHLPPVRYKGQVWIRVGPRKAIATEQEERILSERRVAGSLSFDSSPLQGARLADFPFPSSEPTDRR